MGKVIPFKKKEHQAKGAAPAGSERAAAERLTLVADEIDQILVKYLNDPEIDVRDLVGVLSHRLGTLMCHVDDKTALWDICERVLKRQARMES
jgi:hypothetical protein